MHIKDSESYTIKIREKFRTRSIQVLDHPGLAAQTDRNELQVAQHLAVNYEVCLVDVACFETDRKSYLYGEIEVMKILGLLIRL